MHRTIPALLVVAVVSYAWADAQADATADATKDAGAEAAVLHAEALAAEIDGDLAQSLALLRQASDFVEDDRDILFDRARVAWALDGEPGGGDIQPFMALEPRSDEEKMLRAYIQAEGGHIDEIAALGENSDLFEELEALRTALDGAADPGVERLRVTAMLGAEADSNVTLDASAPPSDRVGARLVLDANVAAVPFESWTGFEVGVYLLINRHLNNRDDLGAYDSAAALLSLSATFEVGPLEAYVFGLLDAVAADSFGSFYMFDAGGGLELRVPMTVTPGIYVQAGGRNFFEGNPEGRPNDRDALHVGAGAMVEWLPVPFGMVLRLGFQMERAQGPLQTQRGIDASLLASWATGGFEVAGGVAFEWRRYPNNLTTEVRSDRRLMPQVDLRYAFFDWLALRGSWVMIRNASRGDVDYSRHIGTLGVEGSY